MSRPLRLSLLAVLLLSSATACRRNRPAAATPAPSASDDADAERRRREAADREAEARRRAEEEARLRAEREAAERALAAARGALEASVLFEFDRSDLDVRARAVLDAKLPVLQANPTLQIRIAGHTDERGSDEYNLALAQRRAAAAKRYLTQRDIDGSRIEIVGLGEEQPACGESTESCWARNRRDEFSITVGSVGPVAAGRQP